MLAKTSSANSFRAIDYRAHLIELQNSHLWSAAVLPAAFSLLSRAHTFEAGAGSERGAFRNAS